MENDIPTPVPGTEAYTLCTEAIMAARRMIMLRGDKAAALEEIEFYLEDYPEFIPYCKQQVGIE